MVAFAIVVVAYDRVEELKKLLEGLIDSNISGRVDLVLSLDRSSQQDLAISVFREVEWPHGDKVLNKQDFNVGLKKNVYAACDLGAEYNSFVVLEEDITVSPEFFEYATDSIKFYSCCSNVAGISLYSYRIKEVDRFPFFPRVDGSDVYFMQFPSSWGQVWTSEQWKKFRNWADLNDTPSIVNGLVPKFVSLWPESSWKKVFLAYLIDENKFFVYPRFSLTSNKGVDGQNHNSIKGMFEVPLVHGRREWSFQDFKDSEFYYSSEFSFVSKGEVDLKEDVVVGSISEFHNYFPISFYRSILYSFFAFKNDFEKLKVKLKKVFKRG